MAFVNRARWDGVRGCRPAVGLVVKDLDDDAMIRASVRGWSRSARLGDQAEKAEATDEEEQGKSNAAAAFERAVANQSRSPANKGKEIIVIRT